MDSKVHYFGRSQSLLEEENSLDLPMYKVLTVPSLCYYIVGWVEHPAVPSKKAEFNNSCNSRLRFILALACIKWKFIVRIVICKGKP